MGVVERSVFLNRTVGSTDLIYVTNWGSYITGYAPIVDPQDETVLGIVGVDYSANSVREHTRTMDLMIGASFFFLILLISIGIFIAFILMARASMEDYLTKLPSRRYFFRRLRDEIRTVKGGNRSFCLMLMDVDWFKMVNDTLGHTEGDRLLVNISGVIRKETRSIDSIARYGGDEFAVILPECSISQGLTIARRIQHAVTLIDATPSRKASLSIGLAQWEPEMDEMMLIECTDKALYQAKAAGKGKISVYEPSVERDS
jgi:diguanylate cyclase (GGDEF)-like protein